MAKRRQQIARWKLCKFCFNQRNDTICTISTQILWLHPTSSHHKLPMVVHKLRVWPHQLVSQWKQDARKQKKQRKERRPHLMLEFPLSLMWHVNASVDVKWSGGIAFIAGLSFALTAKSQVSAWQIKRSYVGSCIQPSITREESQGIDNNEFWHIFISGLGVDMTHLLRNFWFQWLENDPIGCGYFFMPQKIPPWPGLCGPFGHVKGSISVLFETKMSLDINHIWWNIWNIWCDTPKISIQHAKCWTCHDTFDIGLTLSLS